MQCLVIKIHLARGFLNWEHLNLISVGHYSQSRLLPPILPQLWLPGGVGFSLEHTRKPPGKPKIGPCRSEKYTVKRQSLTFFCPIVF